ncbi:MAG: hypothetical protein M0P74_11005 [Syntrophales bacterium]|nr:hypothetical protein [Syntrophales bacterium]
MPAQKSEREKLGFDERLQGNCPLSPAFVPDLRGEPVQGEGAAYGLACLANDACGRRRYFSRNCML